MRQVDARAHRRSAPRAGGAWERPALAAISTAGRGGSAATAIETELAWVSSGRPAGEAVVVPTRLAGYEFPMRSWGTVGVSRFACRPSSVRVALGRRGLQGGAVGVFDEGWNCEAERRVLVRLRTVLSAPARLTSYRGFLRTTVPVHEASLSVQTPNGRRMLSAQLSASGRALLFTSPRCFPD